MQFTSIVLSLAAVVAVAASPMERRTEKYPSGGNGGGDGGNGGSTYDPCSGLYDSAQCCATDVLGVADLDCQTPDDVPTSAADFESICSEGGQRARCCILPILGQSVLCQTPIGL